MAYLPAMPSALPPSELVRLLGHLVLGGITCYGIGLARMRMRHWPRWLIGGLAFGILWHFLWDWIAFSSWTGEAFVWWHNAAAIGLMLSGMLVYGVLVVHGSNHSRDTFAPHDARELWGWPFTIWRPTRSKAARPLV
jgi:RsiW-degrading membrane proteinase PrsW (M82 family)